jgi:hypothetical protein
LAAALRISARHARSRAGGNPPDISASGMKIVLALRVTLH